MKHSHLFLLAVTALIATACQQQSIAQTQNSCAPLGYDKAALLALRDNQFAITDATKRNQFALELVPCLSHPDPVLRDQIAYEGLSHLLRQEKISTDTVIKLQETLVAILQDSATNTQGFSKAFAALALSEIARVDRITPIFTAEQRAEIVNTAINYMQSITDYRGYDEAQGWRHGVAHTADLMLQLALNDQIDKAQLLGLRDAIASQISPTGEHFYIYGESERLARPILFIARRNVFTQEDWSLWFDNLAAPAPMESWNDAFSSQEGLAKLHNLKAFATTIYLNADFSENDGIKALLPGTITTLQALP